MQPAYTHSPQTRTPHARGPAAPTLAVWQTAAQRALHADSRPWLYAADPSRPPPCTAAWCHRQPVAWGHAHAARGGSRECAPRGRGAAPLRRRELRRCPRPPPPPLPSAIGLAPAALPGARPGAGIHGRVTRRRRLHARGAQLRPALRPAQGSERRPDSRAPRARPRGPRRLGRPAAVQLPRGTCRREAKGARGGQAVRTAPTAQRGWSRRPRGPAPRAQSHLMLR